MCEINDPLKLLGLCLELFHHGEIRRKLNALQDYSPPRQGDRELRGALGPWLWFAGGLRIQSGNGDPVIPMRYLVVVRTSGIDLENPSEVRITEGPFIHLFPAGTYADTEYVEKIVKPAIAAGTYPKVGGDPPDTSGWEKSDEIKDQ